MADPKGIPMVCGKMDRINTASLFQRDQSAKPPPPPPQPQPLLPGSTRMWETLPGVIRDNRIDTFRVEANVNATVSNVSMLVSDRFETGTGLTNINLRDDGLQGDRAAGDRIYTSELLRYSTNHYTTVITPYYYDDTNSPFGLSVESVGRVTIAETNGTQTYFLIAPQVGILSADIPLVETIQLSSNLLISPHLLNVLGTNIVTQKLLREYSHATDELTKKIYAVFPDEFDFFVFFSTYRLEDVPYDSYYNLIAGVHNKVQVNYTGTGQALINNSTNYGSGGRLLGLNTLDTYNRGIYSGNCVHEILHQWASFMPAFPFSDGSHYVGNSSAGSLLGGFLMESNSPSSWTINCNEGRNGATHLGIFDKYLMGLVPSNQVPPMRVLSSTPVVQCGDVITSSNVASSTTIQNIIATYGTRTPNSTSTKRDFSVGFVAESNQRLFNQVEMTYYDIFAAHFSKPVPVEQPDPYVGFNWVPVSRFFGEGTIWSSDVMSLIQPKIISTDQLTNGFTRINGTGYPGRNYRLLKTTNLFTGWSAVTNKVADTNGNFMLVDGSPANDSRFYRVGTP